MRTLSEEGKTYAAAIFNDGDTRDVAGSDRGDLLVTFLRRDVEDSSETDRALFYRN